MRSINIYTHSIAGQSMELGTLKRFYKLESLQEMDNIREQEENDLQSFIYFLNARYYSTYDNFFYSYKIPQISKEFDLLRIGKNYNLNIEIKRFADSKKIIKQLVRNKYYLSFLNNVSYLFCFEVTSNKLYFLDDKENLVECTSEQLVNLINNQECTYINDLNELFRPSNYLVSPFNKTQEFIDNKYFLIQQQEEIRMESLQKLSNKNNVEFLILQGEAGSGKTLLTYDVAKELMAMSKRVVIIHCGILNEGHKKLKSDFGWAIYSVKQYANIPYAQVDVVIIDEGQRIHKEQLEKIILHSKEHNINCLLSYDPEQVFNEYEKQSGSLELILAIYTKQFKLTGKIRTNKEIVCFVSNLFNLRNKHPIVKYKNIHINYFNTYEQTVPFIEYLTSKGWNFINYTPSLYQSESFVCLDHCKIGTAHEVIGQEFDKVAVIIDDKFFYDQNKLTSSSFKSNNSGERMLFQAVTRTREGLHIVVINNQEILKKCLDILEQ